MKKHPFFWDSVKKGHFLKVLQERLNNDIDNDNKFRRRLLQNDFMNYKNWQTKVDDSALKSNGKAKKYEGTVPDLIRCIRNNYQHHKENKQKIFGENEDSFFAYWEKKFPLFFVQLFWVDPDVKMEDSQAESA